MKRDIELARAILLAVEAEPTVWLDGLPKVKGARRAEIEYHVILLCDAGLLVADRSADSQSSAGRCARVRLSWDGHEFLEAARNEVLWKKAINAARGTTGGVAIELVRDYLMRLGRRLLNLE